MRVLFAFVTFAVVLVAGTAFAGDDCATKKSEVPDAVLKAFKAAYPDAVMTDCGKEIVEGQTRWEIETKIGEMEKDYVYAEDGTLLQIDEDVSLESLPKEIIESVRKAYPEGEIDEADKITKGDRIQYLIVVEAGEKDYELLLSADGTVISSGEVGEDEDEPGDVDDADEEDDD